MSDFVEVTADDIERRHQEEAEARRAARFAGPRLFDQNGNPITPEQVEAELARGRAMKAQIDADFKANQRMREEEQRQQAAEKAEKERAEQEAHAAQFKRQKLADWIAGGLGTEAEFLREWPEIRRALFAQQQTGDDDEAYLAKKRREMGY